MRLRASISALSTVLMLGLAADAASAAKDAQALLDKYAATWTAERGIKKHTVGKKDVTCELFLDFGVFDEYTCKAAANVCWEGNKMPADAAAPKMGVKTKSASAKPPAPKTTGAVPAAAPAAPKPQ